MILSEVPPLNIPYESVTGTCQIEFSMKIRGIISSVSIHDQGQVLIHPASSVGRFWIDTYVLVLVINQLLFYRKVIPVALIMIIRIERMTP